MKMREKIARALAPTGWAALDNGWCKAGDHHDCYRSWSLVQADAALAAMLEPDEEMIQRRIDRYPNELRIRDADLEVWRDMIAAAQALPP